MVEIIRGTDSYLRELIQKIKRYGDEFVSLYGKFAGVFYYEGDHLPETQIITLGSSDFLYSSSLINCVYSVTISDINIALSHILTSKKEYMLYSINDHKTKLSGNLSNTCFIHQGVYERLNTQDQLKRLDNITIPLIESKIPTNIIPIQANPESCLEILIYKGNLEIFEEDTGICVYSNTIDNLKNLIEN